MNLNHMNKYNFSSDIKASVCDAFSMIYKNTLQVRRNIYRTYVKNNKMYDWYKITQEEVIMPVALSPDQFDSLYFDYYTMESTLTNLQMFGNYLIGDFTKATLPVFSPLSNRFMINDLSGAMFLSLMNEDFRSANAYLRATDMIESIERKSATDTKMNEHSEDYEIKPGWEL